MLRAGALPPQQLPDLALVVENAVLDLAWSQAASPFGGHRLYVLSVVGTHSRVKVGQTKNVRRRVATHRNEYHVNGHGLIDAWISDPLPNARTAEQAARMLLRLLSLKPGHRREEYPAAPFERIRQAAVAVTGQIAAH